ncbi:type III restriction endonuclease [Wenyingzhuangia fucanilytica]|uniref:Type III restriction endonuclease n=1 Tax=Wenyingzhuangia fucanilytica TaxID=1790137 RepID=A0A1B1Y682_9FLAO|nr:DEAD/DEAH box helicase family protein [Wenyingzhuangia fucanilytica]ANW96257.1 type III restriction endonuclease [Wenyingzhuangia fucanilytica]
MIEKGITRLDKRIASKIEDGDLVVELSPIIKNNLKFTPRPYQIEAFTAFNYYLNNPRLRAKPTQVLFHMATGSGKTLVMAGAILELYKLGYRNFIFFVNTDTIIRKTKENFLNANSSKYLFKEQINIEGVNVNITEVDSFESTNTDDISILFSTIQGLHKKLNAPRENSITFDDFIDRKTVLISDEAHHINALTKKKHSASEKENLTSWEHTVERILLASPENIMMEFTATLELSHPSIASKYANKLLYDYSLAKFREDGYSKEVQTNQVDYQPIQRAVVAVLISQFKKKIFASKGILAKPVVMFKSKTTIESAEMEKAFIDEIKNLTVTKLEDLIKLDNEILDKAITYFKELNISLQGLIDEIKEDFSEDKIISVNSKNDTDDKQIVINSLEDNSNEYRAVFAVDKLNEGWDVLNLYDIVRLYDTRDAKGSTPGKTTVAEAQLIGRGARYYPFQLEENQELDKRKYDNDLDNIMRHCETLHYHCSHNPRYITELNNALRQIGMFPEEKVEVDLILKDEFKETSLYKNGFIFLNKKVKNNPKTLLEFQEPTIVKKHTYALRTNRSASTTILDNTSVKQNKVQANFANKHHFSIWDKTIIQKGLNKIPFYKFSNLKQFFPSIKSMHDFITNENYFGGIIVEVTGLQKDTNNLSSHQKLEIVISVATKIANEISTKFGDYRGTKSFYREPLRKYFKNKKLSFSVNTNTTAETGKPTMRNDIPQEYFVDLNKADWYAYNENYGSSEEKFLVKYFHDNIDDLKEKFTNIYLLRNERFFKLYRFSDAKATEPDFVLYMTEKKSDDEVIYQLFIEPKGDHLLYNDEWKEQFLQEIEKEAVIELYESQQYKLIGMPFYNKANREDVFVEKLNKL